MSIFARSLSLRWEDFRFIEHLPALYASATRIHKSVNMTKCALTSALVLVLRCVIVAAVGADFLIAGSLARTHTGGSTEKRLSG